MWTSIGPTWSSIHPGPGPSPRPAGALPWCRKPFSASRPPTPPDIEIAVLTRPASRETAIPRRVATVVALAQTARDVVAELRGAVRAPKRWWCRECKAPITDECGLVEMLCGFCLDDKAEAKARNDETDDAARNSMKVERHHEPCAARGCSAVGRPHPSLPPSGYDRYLRIPAEDWSRGGSDSSQIKCLRRAADNALPTAG